MRAYDFEYDGINLSDKGFIICRFDSGGIDTVSNGSVISFNTVPSLGGTKYNLTSTTYEENLETIIQICKNPCSGDVMEITSSELRELTKWLNRKKFLKFKILDEDYIDVYFEASFNISRIELDGRLYGLELEVITNRPFALKEPRIINIEHTFESGNIHVAHIWEKYKISRNYEITKTSLGSTKPDNCGSTTYTNYEITSDGYFDLSGSSYLGGYCYATNTNRKSIYQKNMTIHGTSASISYTYELWTLGNTYTEEEKGELVERVSSEDINAYPVDGIYDDGNGEYWYVYVKKDIVQDKKIFINDTSYEEGYIYPYTEIAIVEDGDLNIHNNLENRDTYIANCVAGEVITMDYPVIQSSISSHDIQNDFNWNFFRVANTYENSRNDLIISLPCTIKIEYSPIVKVGL